MGREQIEIMSKIEIQKMRDAGSVAAELLLEVGELVKPGVSTEELDSFCAEWTKKRGHISAPLGYPGGPGSFPKSICTSVNEVVCHGIPSAEQFLKDGDIINIDVTPIVDGFHGDTSKTFCVGQVSEKTQRLVDVTRECLRRGVATVRAGARIGDIGAAIQECADGYGVVRDFVGHGIGRKFHTPPQVPHYGVAGRGERLSAGMCFTIEPMINQGSWKVDVLDDGWTAVTRDRKLSAQFEHTLIVTEDGVEIMTQVEGVDPFAP